MNQKTNKSKKQNGTKWETIRVDSDFKKAATDKLDAINDKEDGRKVRMGEMLSMALGKLTPEDVQMLRDRSRSPSDRQEILRQKYVELYGPTSSEEYVAFTLTLAYADFLKEHSHLVAVA